MQYEQIRQLAFQESPAPQVVTRDRKIYDCNKAFACLFGYSQNELIEEQILELYPSTEEYDFTGGRCLEWLQNHTSYEDERFMQHKNGEIFWARARGITLTPQSPFRLMIWSFERIHNKLSNSTKLTTREREISGYIVNGFTCKETALTLNISHRTVEVHRMRVMKKLKAKNTADLVSKIIQIDNS